MSDEHDQHGDGEHAEGGHGGGHGGHGGGPHPPHEEHEEGAPEWLISFADNVALMMGFFVILLAMNMAKPTTGGIGGEGQYPSTQPNENMLDLAISIREAFHSPVDINSTDPAESQLVRRLKQRKEVGETRTPGPDGDRHNLQAPRPSDWSSPTAVVFFDQDDAELDEGDIHLLNQTAETLQGQRWIIEVRGNVSAAEARRNKQTAMKLGFDRALATAAALVKAGMKWEQLRVVSCADNNRARPAASGAAQQADNQRVEIVTTQEQMPADPYNVTTPKAPAKQPAPARSAHSDVSE